MWQILPEWFASLPFNILSNYRKFPVDRRFLKQMSLLIDTTPFYTLRMMVNNYLNYQVIGCYAKNLWENGEEIMRKDNCLRNISNPDDSDADTEKADTYGTAEYNFYTGEYYRSEIMSYWFYRLSEDD